MVVNVYFLVVTVAFGNKNVDRDFAKGTIFDKTEIAKGFVSLYLQKNSSLYLFVLKAPSYLRTLQTYTRNVTEQ